ncbi:MAG: UDP-3-O-(3-hydroxymyristoyl)glucosamine N-acyltransferase [Burkholderiales bacterium]|nr:UDP-3-O-(3-hydroxymyristoyl)glucosamine N-acyltransferase [Betaproteobacteria bacterium]
MKLREIVARFGGELLGAPETEVARIVPLERAGEGDLAFVSSPKQAKRLDTTAAGALIVGPQLRDATSRPRIVCANPYAYFARVSAVLHPAPAHAAGIHVGAVVEQGAEVDPSATVAAGAWVGAGAHIGARSVIESGVRVGVAVRIGEDCHLHPNAVIYHGCILGDRVGLHSGAVIGADGFGLAPDEGRWIKIPQVGRVILGDDVEIGANTTIDRGTLDDTVIEEGVKIDNQVQIGHNCRIGAHTAIAACAGIAGSTRIGRSCRIAGAAMIQGHIEICDGVTVSAATAIMKSIHEPGIYTSIYPFQEHRSWIRNAAHLRHMDSLAEKIKTLEKRLQELEGRLP